MNVSSGRGLYLPCQEKLRNLVVYLLPACAPYWPNHLRIQTLLFLADHEHYRRQLRTISEARYRAQVEGPGIEGYDEMFAGLVEAGAVEERIRQIPGEREARLEIRPLQDPDEAALSSTELRVLDEISAIYCKMGPVALMMHTHTEGPWLMAWNPAMPGQFMPRGLLRWLDNLPTIEDLQAAVRSLSKGRDRAAPGAERAWGSAVSRRTVRAENIALSDPFKADVRSLVEEFPLIYRSVSAVTELFSLGLELPQNPVDPHELPGVFAQRIDYEPHGAAGRACLLLVYRLIAGEGDPSGPVRAVELLRLELRLGETRIARCG